MDGKLIYSFSLVDTPSMVGGDTGLMWSRDLVFVGRWIEAPPRLLIFSDRALAR